MKNLADLAVGGGNWNLWKQKLISERYWASLLEAGDIVEELQDLLRFGVVAQDIGHKGWEDLLEVNNLWKINENNKTIWCWVSKDSGSLKTHQKWPGKSEDFKITIAG